MRQLSELRSLIAGIPAVANASVVQALAGGPVSDSWLIDDREQQMVLRIDTPYAHKVGLDRHSELKVLETVSTAGIGPQVIWADPASGLLITSYIPGQVWTEKNIENPECLEQLARTLRVLHALPATGQTFEPGLAALNYAEGIGSIAAGDLAEKVLKLSDQLLPPNCHRSLCHNDLVYTNIVGTEPVMLIDWEYAAMGDPLFDVAVVVRHHNLPAPIATEFLQLCVGLTNTEIEQRFQAFCELYDLLSALWYRVFNNESHQIDD